MNTIGMMWPQAEKRTAAMPDWSGHIDVTEPFLKALGDAVRAYRASGSREPLRLKVEGRLKSNDAVPRMALTVKPPTLKGGP